MGVYALHVEKHSISEELFFFTSICLLKVSALGHRSEIAEVAETIIIFLGGVLRGVITV